MEDLTVGRISRELESWENDQGKIKNVIENVERSIQFHLKILEDELQDIEVDMQLDTTSITSDDSSIRNQVMAENTLFQSMRVKCKFQKNHYQ